MSPALRRDRTMRVPPTAPAVCVILRKYQSHLRRKRRRHARREGDSRVDVWQRVVHHIENQGEDNAFQTDVSMRMEGTGSWTTHRKKYRILSRTMILRMDMAPPRAAPLSRDACSRRTLYRARPARYDSNASAEDTLAFRHTPVQRLRAAHVAANPGGRST